MSAVHDFRYVTRFTRRRLGNSVLSVLILAMGIGSATAVFSVVDQTVLRRPPFKDGERLVDVANIRRGGGGGSGHSAEKVLAWRDQPSVFERLETFVPRTLDLGGTGEPERITALAVSPGLFDMLDVHPRFGRSFLADDAVPGADPLIIVSARLADRRLGGVETAVGQRLAVGGASLTVIGVMSDAFALLGDEQAWLPMDPLHQRGRSGANEFFVLARLVSGLTASEAQDRANQIADRLQAESPIPRTWDIRIDEKRVTRASPSTKSALLALLGGVGCLWLLACLGAMQLVLTGTIEQLHELRVRACLGASRVRLVGHVMMYVAMLALSGGALGALAAYTVVRVFAGSAPSFLMLWRTAPLMVDARVLAATLVASVVAAFVAGVLPALWITRSVGLDVRSALGASASPRGTERLSSLLVATQIACAVVLVVGAGLMFRTIANVGHIPLGLDPHGLFAMSLNVPVSRYPTSASQFDFAARVLDRLRQAPGVSSAAVAGGLTFNVFGGERLASSEMTVLPDDATVVRNSVSDGYFETLRVKVLLGRTFTRKDMGSDAVILGQTLASRLFPRGDAIGATLRSLDDGRAWMVIGIVDDLDDRVSHDRPIPLQWYLPRSTSSDPQASTSGTATHRLIVRAATLEMAVAAAKAAVWAENPNQPIERVQRASDELRDVFATHFLVRHLATALSAIGLVVAGVGVFGALAQMVARRRREIGVRMAFGATPALVIGMVVGRAATTLATGLMLGLLVAAALTRGLQTVLYGVSPLDPASLSAAVVIVASAGLIAAWWPARSAARVDPAVAIREE